MSDSHKGSWEDVEGGERVAGSPKDASFVVRAFSALEAPFSRARSNAPALVGTTRANGFEAEDGGARLGA